MSERNPFGDDPDAGRTRPNPFGDTEPRADDSADAARRIEQAARKIRGMRGRLGAEGLTPAAMRELINEIAAALDATARAVRGPAEED